MENSPILMKNCSNKKKIEDILVFINASEALLCSIRLRTYTMNSLRATEGFYGQDAPICGTHFSTVISMITQNERLSMTAGRITTIMTMDNYNYYDLHDNNDCNDN